jgi:SAM-dependent methyltransferase
MELMRDLFMQHSPEGDSGPIVEIAARTGLIESIEDKVRLTGFGWKVGDALREYLNWEERGRRMPCTDLAPALREEAFRDRDVLEIGSGFGCNLLSLQPVARSIVGVEIEPLYGTLSVILSRIAGLPAPTVVIGRAEAMPRPDASADILLSLSSIQYMRIERALAEVRRVLRPGGRAVIATSTYAGFLRSQVQQFVALRHYRKALRDAAIALGAAVYPWCGRLLLREFDPVHLPFAVMRNRVDRAGLTLSDEESCIGGDVVVYVAYKR